MLTHSLSLKKRTHYCGDLRKSDEGKTVTLSGWVNKRRDLGGLIFIDLRDREGLVQVVFNPEKDKDLHEKAGSLKSEYVITVTGNVSLRPEGMINEKMPTGEIEVTVKELDILNVSATPPFAISGEEVKADEITRLKYRYLDLRTQRMQRNLKLRHIVATSAREYLNKKGFYEIETPMFIKSTPEGARDYLVPSRLYPGCFYALPQSPQIFKQLLMVSGFDKYYQIARCFRDEDQRADRQPEFTQIDIEMSFVERDDVLEIAEGMMIKAFKDGLGVTLESPFPRLTYEEAINFYGSDKPDLRYDMKMEDLSEIFSSSEFKIFQDVISKNSNTISEEKNYAIKGIKVSGQGDGYSRKKLDSLTEKAKELGAGGLLWLKYYDKEVKASFGKFLKEEETMKLKEKFGLINNDLLLIVADEKKTVNTVLGNLRIFLAKELGLINKEVFKFLWVLDFPLFEYNEEEKRMESSHHPFTSPMPEDIKYMDTDPLRVRSSAYDIVLNGVEIGSGSIRIHRRDIQEKIFDLLGLSREEAEKRFGFLLGAFEYGAPPHGGIAPGLDRLVMLMAGEESIREVITFPKTQTAFCPLTEAPVNASDEQLKDLHLKVEKD